MEVKKENNRVSLFIDGKMVGFATFPSIGEGVVVINHTMVYPLYQGKGYASKLMEAVVEVLKETNIDNLTPKKALDLLYELKGLIEE